MFHKARPALAAMKCSTNSSGISALLWITESTAVFGANLKTKYPFYVVMIGSALGYGYVTLTNVMNISSGADEMMGFICIQSKGMLNLMGTIISLIDAFITTVLFSKLKKFNFNIV